MSGSLSIELDPGPIDRTPADVAVIALFASERPLRGGSGRADWRLCGRLSELLVSGKLAGTPGEAALISSGGGLRAPLLLVLGAGPRAAFDAPRLHALTRDGVCRALNLGACSIAFPFPDRTLGGLALEQHAEALRGAAAAGVASRRGATQLVLRLVVPRDEARRTAEALRAVRTADLPSAISLRLPRPPGPRPAGVPAGLAPAFRNARQPVK
jgi:hypothetical protein